MMGGGEDKDHCSESDAERLYQPPAPNAGKMNTDTPGCGAVRTRWFLDSLENGNGGQTIVIWITAPANASLRNKFEVREELVLLREAVVKLHGLPEWIECERAELVAPLIQRWAQRHEIRVMIGRAAAPAMKALIETFHYEQDQRRLLKTPGRSRSSFLVKIAE